MFFVAAALAGFTETARLTADLDEDGQPELVTAGFDAEGAIHVVVTEADGRHAHLDLGVRGDIMGPRDRLELSAPPVSETGVPLATIYVPRGEYCGSGNTWIHIAYRPERGITKALEVGDFSDAPVWSSVETRFDPRAQAVRVTYTYGEEGRTTGRDVTRYEWRDGAFVAR